jgi:hypothetical protein
VPDDEDEIDIALVALLVDPAHPHCTACDDHIGPDEAASTWCMHVINAQDPSLEGIAMLCPACSRERLATKAAQAMFPAFPSQHDTLN